MRRLKMIFIEFSHDDRSQKALKNEVRYWLHQPLHQSQVNVNTV